MNVTQDLLLAVAVLMFLYIARGSAGEVRSMLTVGSRRPYLSNFKSEISDLIKLAESCSLIFAQKEPYVVSKVV